MIHAYPTPDPPTKPDSCRYTCDRSSHAKKDVCSRSSLCVRRFVFRGFRIKLRHLTTLEISGQRSSNLGRSRRGSDQLQTGPPFVLVRRKLEADKSGARKRTTVLRGTTLNRTYGTHKNLYISLILLAVCGPIYYGPK